MTRKFTVLFIFLLIARLSFGQGIIGLINKSGEFFDNLSAGKFEDAQAMADESIKDKLTVDLLKNFWAKITKDLGAFESVDGAQNRIQGEFYLVTLNCKFANGNQSFQFAYNKAEKLVGFVIVPKSTAPQYILPSYADTSKYTEKMLTLKATGHDLAAVLTLPKNKTNVPIVVMVHGSGPHDMDETIGPNKPFRDIAAGLATKGVASIRYVKRTLVYPNEFTKSFTVKQEVTDDALGAIALAKTIPEANKQQIYLLGHSLGGMLAPQIAALSPDLKGMVLVAAPARKLADMVAEQYNYLFKQSIDTGAAAKKALQDALAEVNRSRITQLGKMAADSTIFGLPASYWVDLNSYNQVAVSKKYTGRILVIQGGFDYQVSVRDYDLWKEALAANKNATFKLYPRLNHLLSPQSSKGGPDQYALMVNVADYLVSDLAAWITTGTIPAVKR